MTGQSHFQRIFGRLYWIVDAVLYENARPHPASAAFYDLPPISYKIKWLYNVKSSRVVGVIASSHTIIVFLDCVHFGELFA